MSTARSKRAQASECISEPEVSPLESLAMPQPLSRVKPNAFFRHDPNALDDKPHLAKLVANIFAHWGLVEYRLSLLLVRVLGADAAPALAMFSTLTAQHLQLGALEAAAKVALSLEEFDVFQAGIAVTDSVQTPRNQLAHWIWGTAPELPKALLLAEPKSAKERDRELALALERSDTQGVNTEEMARLNSYDPARINVYTESDLQRAERDIEEASTVAFLVVVYLDGLFRGRRRPTDPSQSRLTRAHVFRQLYGQRLFREAWDRIRADRQSNPLPPPE
jgi:hypothetical protein